MEKIKLPFDGIPMNKSAATAVERGMVFRSHLTMGGGIPRGGAQRISVAGVPRWIRIDCGAMANCLRISSGVSVRRSGGREKICIGFKFSSFF